MEQTPQPSQRESSVLKSSSMTNGLAVAVAVGEGLGVAVGRASSVCVPATAAVASRMTALSVWAARCRAGSILARALQASMEANRVARANREEYVRFMLSLSIPIHLQGGPNRFPAAGILLIKNSTECRGYSPPCDAGHKI